MLSRIFVNIQYVCAHFNSYLLALYHYKAGTLQYKAQHFVKDLFLYNATNCQPGEFNRFWYTTLIYLIKSKGYENFNFT